METAGNTVLAGVLAIFHHNEVELPKWSLRMPCMDRPSNLPGTRDGDFRDRRSLVSLFNNAVGRGSGEYLLNPAEKTH